jgi:UDP-3-O-[3-hydroxymyristoyl] glucosamine N-acyltransferase
MHEMNSITIKLSELAQRIGATLDGSDCEVSLICSIDDVRDGCVTFAERQYDFEKMQGEGLPAAVIGGPKLQSGDISVLRCKNPRLAFARAVATFHPEKAVSPGIHPSAVVDSSARIDDSANIGPLCVVGPGASIGAKTSLVASVYVGAGVQIGDHCEFHPGVRVYNGSKIGNHVILHSGVVVGSDGFGYVRGDDGRQEKVPQVGGIVIEDDVEIGANSTLDRGALGLSVVGSGTKIDNLVQVGHNVRLGRNVILCGQVGISGSVTIGDNTILAGQVGVADHTHIGKNCVLAGKAGVDSNVPDNSFYSGHPARPHRENMKSISNFHKLPALMEKLKQLENKEPGD